jgi:type IV secretion system protein TrbL
MDALRAATSMGSAASAAYSLGRETSGKTRLAGAAAGISGVASAAAASVSDRTGLGAAATSGRQAALRGGAGSGGGAASSGEGVPDGMPDWARRLRSEQTNRHRRHAAIQAMREGDHPGAAANPDIKERED